MKPSSPEQNTRSLRKKRNDDLIKRMVEGEPLQTHDAFSSWYPPRPVIAKDRDAISKLYNDKDDLSGKRSKASVLVIVPPTPETK